MPSTPVRAAVAASLARIGAGLYGVACSGGADSLALADAAITVAGAAHVVVLVVDHGLQPDSGQIADRVAAWARGQGAAAVVRRVALAPRASREAAAREARYGALTALADELGCVAVLLGHTARDQAETVLLRILRGTGPAGLVGMAAARGRFVRPLLALPRAAIDAYCAARGLAPWTDPMNADPAFARVRVRQELMPLLAAHNPAIADALLRLAATAAEWLAVLDAQASRHTWPLDCRALAAELPAIRKRVIAVRLEATGYEATHLEAIDALVTSPRRGTRALDVPGGTITRTYDSLSFVPAAPSDRGVPLGDAGGLAVTPGAGELTRTWRPGDRIKLPRLAGHSRKLSDLFTDLRIPRAARASARVIVRISDGEIVWAEHVGPAR